MLKLKKFKAAVAFIFSSSAFSEAEVLLIQRSEEENDPWAGHMAFPGGGMDAIDKGDSLSTAIRETEEEVGLKLERGSFFEQGKIVRPLKKFHQMELELIPYVFVQPFNLSNLRPCNIEVKNVVNVPFKLFLDESNYKNFSSIDSHWGCDVWEGPPVWGLTLDIILQFITQHPEYFSMSDEFLQSYEIRRSNYLD